jgi:hypothetical protein
MTRMASTSSNIGQRQDEPELLRFLRARSQIYRWAERWQWMQLLLMVAVPIVGSVYGSINPDARSYVAGIAALMAIFDVVIMDRRYRKLIRLAAKAAEAFDVALFRLPWSKAAAGAQLDAEYVSTADRKWRGDEGKLRGWYPVSVDRAPIDVARIICQRTNAWYDAELRRFYANLLAGVACLVVAGLIIFGIVQDLKVTDLLVTVFVPVAPIIIWSARERYRQIDAAEANEGVKSEAESLLGAIQSGKCSARERATQSRQLQNVIYTRRAANPMLFPFLYRVRRRKMEESMQDAADHWLKQLGY